MHAVVVSFDHFHLGFIGCYGNDWVETPNLDRLAAESIVFDQHFGENFDRDAPGQAWWTGHYEFSASGEQAPDQGWLARLLRSGGVKTRLLVESDVDDGSIVAPDFDEVSAVTVGDETDVPQAQGGFARLVTEAGRSLAESAAGGEAPTVLWLKSRGVPIPWIPPREFADLYLDELGLADESETRGTGILPVSNPDNGDEPEDEFSESVPEAAGGEEAQDPFLIEESIAAEFLATEYEPVEDSSIPPEDIDNRYARALYAGYVTYLDRWLGKLLAFVNQSPHCGETLLIVVAGGGEALGEHGVLGDEGAALREELVHAPLIVRIPGSDQAGSRRAALVQTVDIGPTLLDWFGSHLQADASDGWSLLPLIKNELDSNRDAAYMGLAGQSLAIRTSDFYYVREENPPDGLPRDHAELFEKPSDRWDMANVAGQFPQVVEELDARLSHFRPQTLL